MKAESVIKVYIEDASGQRRTIECSGLAIDCGEGKEVRIQKYGGAQDKLSLLTGLAMPGESPPSTQAYFVFWAGAANVLNIHVVSSAAKWPSREK